MEFEFACIREASKSLEGYRPPEFEMRFDVLTPGARIGMPARTLRARTRLLPPAGGWPAAAGDGHAVFAAKGDCLRIDPDFFATPAGGFTIEAWVKPGSDRSGAIVSNRKDRNGFGLEIADVPAFRLHSGGKMLQAKAAERLPAGTWIHLAGVHSGGEIALFVNGRRAASTPVEGEVAPSSSPLYIGAMPGQDWVLYEYPYASSFWAGAIDDVRLSRGARYREDFAPEKHPARDGDTVFLLASDQRFGDFVPVEAEPAFQAAVEGKAVIASDAR